MRGQFVNSIWPLFGCTRCEDKVYVYRCDSGICNLCIKELEDEE